MNAHVIGQYTPDLHTVFCPEHPYTLTEAWKDIINSFYQGKLPQNSHSTETLTNLAAWIHEYTHFIQYSTRLLGLEYLTYSNVIALTTNKAVKSYQRTRRSNHPFLPLHKHLFEEFRTLDEWPNILKDWMGLWLKGSIHLSILGLSPMPTQHRDIHGFIEQHFPHVTRPRYVRKAEHDSNNTQEIVSDITTESVLEVEAFISSVMFMRLAFPDRTQEVISSLHPHIDADTNLALNILENGQGALVPVLSDFALQVIADPEPSSISQRLENYQEYQPAFRFMHGLSALERYTGIEVHEIEKHSEDIIRLLAREVGPSGTRDDIHKAAISLTSNNDSSFSADEALFLQKNLLVRAGNPSWFFAPTIFWTDIFQNLRIPFVKCSHTRIPDGISYLSASSFGRGDTPPHEHFGLLISTYMRWCGRELHKSYGRMVCPVCFFDHHDQPGSCSMQCQFSTVARSLLGFHPIDYWYR